MATAPTLRRAMVAEGVSIPYADQGAATGPCVVMIPGLGDSWRTYERVLGHLPDDVRALALSMRGHGDADRPDSGYAVADLAADVVALLDGVGVASAVIVGHSSASFVALHLAAVHSARVTGLVLIGAPASFRDHPDAARFDQVFGTLTDPVDPSFVRQFTEGLVAEPIPVELLETQVSEVLKVPARVIRATWAGIREFDPSTILDRVNVPTLVLWGEADAVPVASRQVQDALVQTIAEAKLVGYSGVGHCPHWEQPGRLASDVAAFVRQVAEGAP
jgi:pimeloyl-ACP methyl ester carboxylesterase